MKNLKYTTTFCALVLSGAILTGCSFCNVSDEHYHIYYDKRTKEHYYSEEESQKQCIKLNGYITNDEKGNFLLEKKLFLLDDVRNEINKLVQNRDTYFEAWLAYPYFDEDGKIAFHDKYKLLPEDDILSQEGILRTGDSIKYVVYTVESKDGNYEAIEHIVDNLDNLEGEYYIDFDNFTSIVNPKYGRVIDGEFVLEENYSKNKVKSK